MSLGVSLAMGLHRFIAGVISVRRKVLCGSGLSLWPCCSAACVVLPCQEMFVLCGTRRIIVYLRLHQVV